MAQECMAYEMHHGPVIMTFAVVVPLNPNKQINKQIIPQRDVPIRHHTVKTEPYGLAGRNWTR